MILCNNYTEVPEKTIGVYMIYDHDGFIVYIGKSKCVRNRIEDHFHPSGNSKKNEHVVLKLKSEHYNCFSYVETSCVFEAEKLEKKLIKKIKPHFNKQYINKISERLIEIEKKANEIVFESNKDEIDMFINLGNKKF